MFPPILPALGCLAMAETLLKGFAALSAALNYPANDGDLSFLLSAGIITVELNCSLFLFEIAGTCPCIIMFATYSF